MTRFRNLVVALDIKDKSRQKALLLHYAGEEVNDIFDTLPDTEADEGENPLDKAIDALTAYFQPKQNVAYEEYQFRLAKQVKDEALMTFYTRLKRLALTCEFTDADREIKSQIIQQCSSSKLRRKALSEPKISLQQLLEYGKAMEQAESQAANLEGQAKNEVNYLSHDGNSHFRNKSQSKEMANRKCRNCGGPYPHQGDRTTCPAYGQECRNCGKLNHFKAVCRSTAAPKLPDNRQRQMKSPRKYKKKLRYVSESSSSDDYEHEPRKTSRKNNKKKLRNISKSSSSDDDHDLFKIRVRNVKSDKTKHPFFEVKVGDTWLNIMADSGSSINILDERDFNKLKTQPTLEPTNIRVYPYKSKTCLPVKGKFNTTIKTAMATTPRVVVYVMEGTGGSLLSWQTSQDLNLIHVSNHLKSVEEDTTNTEVKELVQEYSDLFSGLGKLQGYQVKLHIDENVQPVAQPHRRVPFHIRKQLEEQLDKDEQQGVIEQTDGPTPWVSPIVVAPKPKQPGKIRVCVDMRQANQAIQRERHLTPTIKEVIADLNGAKYFSKLDLNQGYNQIELAPESRYITTFSTHLGLRRFTRLNFGISSAAEIFQNAIRETLHGIQGAINISDDILVYGKTQEDHNKSLRETLQRLREKGLTLHSEKCSYSKSKLEFFGYIFSDKGMSADPQKVEEILKLAVPTNTSEVRSLLGMTNYCARFIQGYATMTQPLRELIQKKHPWRWTPRHDQSLAQLKDALTNAPVTSYFDPDKETEIVVDASPVGLGAILAQKDPETSDRHIVAYASKSLSETERRYSQTEREALAVVWGCEYFHLYVYGKPITVCTDHKPLISIYGNPKSKPPARIERWALRLQPYQVSIVYQKGENNPADYMSRHPAQQTKTTTRQAKVAEEFVNYIIQTSTPKAIKLEEINVATSKDPTLQAVIDAVRTGNWSMGKRNKQVNQEAYKAIERVKDELTISTSSNTILRGTRIVIPQQLQQRVVTLAHEGHQGIVKTKALLRDKVWFPGIDQLTEKTIKSCFACQVSTPTTQREPLKMSPLPDSAWQEVSVDFKDLSTKGYLLVVTDDYSRYPVVDIVSSTSANAVIPRLDKIFAEFGIPEVVKSDNGPPFNGRDFKNFAETLGFRHRKVTPLWPRANGGVERFMRTIKKTIHTATAECKPWKEEMCKLLRNYRTTPHSSTGMAPATAMFNRNIRTKLPEIPSNLSDQAGIRDHDSEAKRKMKSYADNKAYVKPQNISVGDAVIVKRDPSCLKSATPYDLKPYVVTEQKGTMITAARGDKEITRNSSQFKQIEETEVVLEEGNHTTREHQEPLPIRKQEPTPKVEDPAPRRYPERSSRCPPAYLADYVAK